MNTISFPRIFNPITGKTNLVTDEDSINNCLDLLFSTTVGELFGDPQFGCDLVSLFYEYEGELLEDLIKTEIVETITKYERRIQVSEDSVSVSYINDKAIIRIKYYILSTDSIGVFDIVRATEGE